MARPFFSVASACHPFLEPKGTAIALVVLTLTMYLAYTQRAAYRPLFGL